MSSVLCVVLLWTAAWADLPFKKKAQPVQTPSPQELAQTLRSGTAVQRNDLARELGILAPSNGAAKSTAPCVDFSHVEERKATLRAGDENVLLLADSTACDSLYLIVFDKAPKSEWRHVQTVRLTARRQRPEVSFVELVQPGVSEVVIHHGTTRDGGAVMQEDLVVLKMLHDRIETVLLTTEHSEITLTNRQAGESDNLQQKQVSTFELLKPAPNSATANRLLEKQVITDNKTTITRYQVWTWDPELERFRPAAFDGGDVRPAAPPKKPATAPTK